MDAKHIADKIEIGEKWREKRNDITKHILEEKANQCQHFKQRLIKTGENGLIEDTNHPFRGRGKDHTGQTIFGILLDLL